MIITLAEWEIRKRDADNQHDRYFAVLDAFQEIDKPIAEDEPCTDCGGAVRADMYVDGNKYHVAAICETCRQAVEF